MSTDDDRDGAESYVQQVRENTQQFSTSLLEENAHLRLVLTGLINEKLAYHEQNLRLREDLEGQRRNREQLLAHLTRLEAEQRRFTEQFIVIEQQNTNLAKLYVASYRMHSTLERREVVAIIQEIVINLIGCEEMALFELLPDGRTLMLLAAHGVEASQLTQVSGGRGIIGAAALSGRRWIRGADELEPIFAEERGLTACIPLKLNGQVTGVIALFRLLEHKSQLEGVDFELFDLLASHAATALHCSLINSRLRSAGLRW